MTAARLFGSDRATEGADPIVEVLLPRRDERIVGKAVAVALVLHAAFFFVSIPERSQAPPLRPRASPTLTLHRTPLPPPPEIPPVTLEPITFEPRPWLAGPPPEQAGPIRREAPPALAALAPPEFEDLIADPVEPSAPAGPVEPFDPGVVPPVLIPACKVTPGYPELARAARREGRVVLRATIRADGTVGEAEVLSARPAGLGFEESAINAVLQWCYEPGTWNGSPVDVFFTIYVSFDLN